MSFKQLKTPSLSKNNVLIFNKNSQTFESTLFTETVMHGFGTRMSGNGRDVTVIDAFLRKQKVRFSRIIDPDQQHTDRIFIIDSSMGTEIENCDGLITMERRTVLTVITADCAPIIYSDFKTQSIGISHNGRKGTELKLAPKMITKLQSLGSKLQDIRIAIGPAIGACCYPMNLLEENVRQLMEIGIKNDQIDFFPFCTNCDSQRFFSFRGSNREPHFLEQFSYIALSH